MKFSFIFLAIFFANIYLPVSAQHRSNEVKQPGDCQPKEIGEIIFKKKMSPEDTARKFNAFLLPYIAYSPTKGVQLGAGGTLSWYSGTSYETNQSAANAMAEFTSKEQKLYQLKSNVYTDRNKWFLQGDWRYYIYSLPTYGLGTGYNSPIIPVEGYDPDSVSIKGWNDEFLIKYRWVKLHEIFSFKVRNYLYVGVGYHLDYHYKIEDTELRTDSSTPVITPHYSYSVKHGFNPEEYVSSGLSLNFVFDNRDNLINPYKGYFVNVNYKINQTWLGSDKPSGQLWTEFRTYIGLDKKMPRHLLALWMFGGFQTSGEVPYFDLWATGFDQMNSSGRGYLQGRWRGENLMYGEFQYRFPISQCTQVLGGVLFANVSTASSKDQNIHLFNYLRPAYGAGLRILVDKVSRTNILIDYTFGENSGIYFSAQETV